MSICFFEVRSRREWSRRESSDIDEASQGERAGASESIEAQTWDVPKESQTRKSHRPFPAGIEPTFKFTRENLTFITMENDK